MGERRRAVIWSPDARADLSEIWNYYVEVAGRHTADGIVRRIAEVCTLLEEHPFAGRARNEVRLPLVPVVETTEAAIRRAMVHAGILNA